MKKIIFIHAILITIGAFNRAYAECRIHTSCTGCVVAGEILSPTNNDCGSVSTTHYAVSENGLSKPTYTVYSCASCKSGYSRREQVAVLSPTCIVQYNICEENCTGCTGCTSDATWSAAGTGYEKKVTATCNCNTCNRTTQYRCAAGYYGRPTNGTSGCSPCDKIGGHGTSNAGSTAKTSCYVPANSNITDTIGTYHFTSNCFYMN